MNQSYLLALFPVLSTGSICTQEVPTQFVAPTAKARSSPALGTTAGSEQTELLTWAALAEQELAQLEYAWSPLAAGVCGAPNRAQGLRACITPSTIEVFPRAAEVFGQDAEWKLVLRTLGFGVAGNLRALVDSQLTSNGRRLERRAAGISEWFENRAQGIEQGWVVQELLGTRALPLRIELAVEGLTTRVAEDGLAASFIDGAGKLRVRYGGLKAWDATGQDLRARMFPVEGGLAIEVELESAHFPITIDPLLSGPVWSAEGNQDTALFGASVDGCGDVNGDGYADIVVGAQRYDSGQVDEGAAFLFLGSASGPSTTPNWTAVGGRPFLYFGISVAGAGDVNGDGFDDLIVGGPQYEDGQLNEGAAYVYHGSASGLSLTPAWMAESNQGHAWFGTSVSGAGDVNGDGFDDVLVGANSYTHGHTDEGRAFLYYGSSSGLSLNPDWTGEANNDSADFGFQVAAAGDVNGDGYDDVVVGARHYSNSQFQEGAAFLYLGSPQGLAGTALWKVEGGQDFAECGFSVAGAGDVNGDGFDEILIGSKNLSNGETREGSAALYLGSSTGPALAADWNLEAEQAEAALGSSVSTAGDVNGDGYDDWIVGAPQYDQGESNEGVIYLFLGSPAALPLTPDFVAEPNSPFANLGHSLSAAGDVNNDGLDDVVVGGLCFTNGENCEGGAFLYFGQSASLGAKYCTANSNSVGAPADINASGSASAATGELTLQASPVPNQSGIFYHGPNQAQLPFGNGFQCVGGGVVRGAVLTATNNVASYTYDNSTTKHDLSAFSGTNRNFQYWFRDPMGGGALFNTSNAVSIGILP